MKRLLLTGLLICGLSALVSGGEGMRSGQFLVTITDSITVVDTQITKFRIDTVITASSDVHKYNYIQFYCQMTQDTNAVNDSVVIKAQFSPALGTPDWQDVADSIFAFAATADTVFGPVYRLDTMNVLSDLMRFHCVFRDSNEVTMPNILNNTYDINLVIRFKGWK